MTDIAKVMALPHWREPVIGEKCWVRSSYYIDHGHDDFCGGEATIKKVIDTREDPHETALGVNKLMVELEERPGWQKNWFIIVSDEEKNKETYAGKKAHNCPDGTPNYGW